MSHSYKVNVNHIFDFEIDPTSVSKLDSVDTADGYEHIIQNYRSYKAEVTEADFAKKHYKVRINNTIYTIQISNDLDVLIADLGFEMGNAKQIEKINAPMPGLILQINVSIGEKVKENDPLLILEAMKMENIISSPREGIIKTIAIAKGDAVEKNQLLIEFE